MAFPNKVIEAAWERARGGCECRRKIHNHRSMRCNKVLSFKNRGRTGWGCWEAHHLNSSLPDTLSNCEILCWECHCQIRSFEN